MILSPVIEAVVGCFMIIPDRDQRSTLPKLLQVGICMVLGVPLPIIIQSDDFVVGAESAAGGAALGLGVTTFSVFIDVITHMDPGVIGLDRIDFGGLAIH